MNTQKGSVLIITFILLLMISIMAVTQMSLNSTQTHVATNTADAQVAFETAEGALSDATNNLFSNTYTTANFLSNANGLYLFDPTIEPRWTTVDWSSNAVITSFQGHSSAASAYIIEQLPSSSPSGQDMNRPSYVFRITARAVGASGNGVVLLQSTVQMQQ